jgi:hypothetical protein
VVAVGVELFLHQLVHDGLVLRFLRFELGVQAVVVLFVAVLRQLLQHFRVVRVLLGVQPLDRFRHFAVFAEERAPERFLVHVVQVPGRDLD